MRVLVRVFYIVFFERKCIFKIIMNFLIICLIGFCGLIWSLIIRLIWFYGKMYLGFKIIYIEMLEYN